MPSSYFLVEYAGRPAILVEVKPGEEEEWEGVKKRLEETREPLDVWQTLPHPPSDVLRRLAP